MKLRAIEYVMSLERSKQTEQDIPRHLKKEFDLKFHPTWQCVAGKNFGSDIDYEDKHMIYFSLGNISILLWKAG